MTAALQVQEPPHLRARIARCMSVSVITTVISVTTIVVATAAFGLSATRANILATCVATVPSYHLNRRWTWGRRDPSNPWLEVAPFWAMAFAGLALSTLTVAIADSWAAQAHLTALPRTVLDLTGHLGGFGVLWIAQFAILDRVVFATHSKSLPPVDHHRS